MRTKSLLAAGIALLGLVPADAALLLYDLRGADAAKYSASFTLDTSRAPSIVIPDTVRYNGVPITFTRPNSAVVATASTQFTGPSFQTLINQGGFYLGSLGGFPVGFSVFGPQLFTGTTAAPTFLTGTFGLSDVPRTFTTDPVRVNYTLTVTDVTAAAVPEPAAWGLMLAGFGLVGAALRRPATRLAATC